MLKIFRNIRRDLLTENKFRKYILYAIGEIFLVVIGILIALQINNWNNLRIEKKAEQTSYQNIRQQIVEDSTELSGVKAFNLHYLNQYAFANEIIKSNDRKQIDTLALITIYLSQYSDFHGNGNIFQNLVNSGEINLLQNAAISNSVQKLEMIYAHLNKLEDIHWEIISNELTPEVKGVINYATMEIIKPDKLYSVELQNIFVEIIFLTKGKDVVYNQALEKIRSIIELIEEEVDNKS
jgi:hypothetical protein